MAGWSFQRKLIATVMLIGLLAIISSGASLVISRVIVGRVDKVAANQAQILTDSRQLQIDGIRKILDARTWVLTGDAGYVVAARSGSAAMRDQIASLKARIKDSPGEALLTVSRPRAPTL